MYFSINQSNYWYEIHGNGEPIVMLHGFTGSSRTWNYFVNKWKNKWTLITIDLPGHGKTKAKEKSMEACCKDLDALFNALKLSSFCLLGYSMGGRTAISYAIHYPEKIKALLLESTSPGIDTLEERVQRQENDRILANRILEQGLDWFVSYWENIPLFQSQTSLPLEIKQSVRYERHMQSKTGLADSLLHMGTGFQPSWWDALARLTKPVLLLAGELDKKYCELMKEMDNRFPQSLLTIVSEAGHAIHVEKPEIFGKIVSEYITDIYLADICN
ncbi:2-succinyl-6-hydroxy-2,4-cyclohexadiene-1-carboxylate synthase [Virgibacillus sp. AGTR]|nr:MULTISPECIES: 2-succinyl-6-hydroxy-2,4-cyclohexadiene-1-carboxylate synthase [Bacillaceae]MCC2249448.1 2-succinyl-6-hydroxy-2,4-cyclohexadiene-1-carboxylate synthase [Virgibacillus sp. AGTR]MDY7043354.1 2-succinyl-6-hydroxy-2,4-cyclohexadiene-1-carboxylate synthase [Virgibacillus sp. M23]WBX78842.1 2-succinyl-6-hydroxy-2,4-cyclohexadiene-1-carboxylate synthase [Virgibacillus salarius]